MSVVIGFLFFILNIVVVLAMVTDKYTIFLDFHAFLAVVISSFVWVFIAFRPRGVMQLLRIFSLTIRRREDRMPQMMEEVINVAKSTRGEVSQQTAYALSTPNLFLKDGVSLIADGFSDEQIDAIMQERIESLRDHYRADEKLLKALRAMPPSFGLLGTTTGLIALFSQVGGADAAKSIGPAMSVALTATLYGLLLGFCVFNPISERLGLVNFEDLRIREMTKKGVLLIKKKVSPSFIEEMLSSYLTIRKQNERKGR